MNILRLTVTGIILLAFTMNIIGAAQEDKSPEELIDDINEYDGSMGPDNALYGLKLAFESLDESFTFNTSEKLEKKIDHSKLRISEAKSELKKKNNEGARKAIEYYREKIKETEGSISGIKGNDSGIIRAQKMIKKNQYVLEKLLESHPNNTGLINAYNNSVELENRFEEKTERKLERIRSDEGKHYLKEIKKEIKEGEGFEKSKNKLQLHAKIIGNNSQIEIKLNFPSNKTDNLSIADEIINELRLSRENISDMLIIEDTDDNETRSILKAQAMVGLNVSGINFDYRFVLDKTNRTEIIDGIHNKLLNLTKTQILEVLEIKAIRDDREKGEKDKHDTTRKERNDNRKDRKDD